MPRQKLPTKWTRFQNIGVDELNPRQDPQDGQREAIRELIKNQDVKILNLVMDINTDGLSQAERFMVIEPENKRMPYISIDGNRRLLALKLLEDPTLAEGILSKPQMKTLEKEAEKFAQDPIEQVEIVIYPDRVQGGPWVARRHALGLAGRGQDSWGSEEKARFDAWLNEDDGSPEYQILQFVRNHSGTTDEEREQFRKFPLTTLRRVITTDYAKAKFGYQLQNGKVVTSYADDEFVKPFKKMMLEMTHPDKATRLKVDKLKTAALQKGHFDKYTEDDLPSSKAPQVVPHHLGEKNQPVAQAKKPKADDKPKDPKPKDTKQTTQDRKHIIPKECVLNITTQRIYDIYDELKNKLDSNTTRNACAVLMRVFIELSVDDYIARTPSIPVSNSKGKEPSLGDKLWSVAEFAANNNLITPAEAEVVKEGTLKENFLAPRVRTMNSYVHTAHTPLSGDLRAHWNNVEHLMKVIWAPDPVAAS